MELEPIIKPKPLPFPDRCRTVRRDEDVWKIRRMEVLGSLLTGLRYNIRTSLTTAGVFVEALKDLEHLEVLGKEDSKIEEATTPNQQTINGLTMKQLTLQERRNEYLDRTSKNIKRVLDLIGQVRLPVQPSECQISIIVGRELENRRAHAEKKGIFIQCQELENLPPILAYEWPMSHVFFSLIERAIFVTPPGGSVTVSGRVDQAQGTVIVEVKDTGPGIARQLCDAFNRGEELKGSEIPVFFVGDPFDLQRARRIAEIHGGRISIESGEGAETKFSISLSVR